MRRRVMDLGPIIGYTTGMGTTSTVTVRPVEPGDDAGLTRLAAGAADTGRVGFAVRYVVPPSVAELTRTGDHGFVAVTEGGEVVGSARVQLSQVLHHGRRVPFAMLHSLGVDRDHRRQGIAGLLTRARLEYVDEAGAGERQRYLVAATIQAGNAASRANARSWADDPVGRVAITPTKPATRPPRALDGISVRPARDDELARIADGLVEHARGHTLCAVPDADELARWLSVRLGDDLLHHYYVATDQGGRIVAGLGIDDATRLSTVEVTRMPAPLRLANLALHAVPRDRVMRTVNVRYAWFPPGRVAAARHLWDQVRWDWRDRATNLVTVTDIRSPLVDMLHAPRWAPRTTIEVVVRRDPPFEVDRGLPLNPVA